MVTKCEECGIQFHQQNEIDDFLSSRRKCKKEEEQFWSNIFLVALGIAGMIFLIMGAVIYGVVPVVSFVIAAIFLTILFALLVPLLKFMDWIGKKVVEGEK